MAVLTYLCAEHGTNLVGASPVTMHQRLKAIVQDQSKNNS